MNIVSIEKHREIQNDITQFFFTRNTFEIIISKVKKGAKLQWHSHKEAQIGIFLHGKFLFKTCNDKIEMKKHGDSYIVEPEVVHSAEAKEDFFAFDYKYSSFSKKNRIQNKLIYKKNIFQNSNVIETNDTLITHFYTGNTSFSIDIEPNYNYYFIASKDVYIKTKNNEVFYKKMEILLLHSNTSNFLLISKEKTSIILIKEKRITI